MARLRQEYLEARRIVWKIGAYIRLSRDDGKEVSVSIENQVKEIKDFLDTLKENYEVVDYYKDDGFSGTDSNRKNFQRLLNDVRNGDVNCVIVRDPSRLSRNYIEAGMYMEQLFVELNVRFISLSLPQLDSYKHPEMMNTIALPIQNVINDDFCRQTSQKIRGVFNMKRSRGEFIGAFAPYGYKKISEKKGCLFIDEEAAQVVKMVYHLFVYEGMSKGGIARELNHLGIHSPAKYKQLQGLKYNNQGRTVSGLWSPSTIVDILSNQMYIGNMVQGKQKVKSYKVHDVIKVAKEDWFIVENTHEAIIDKVTFQKAQSLHKKDTRTTPGNGYVALFAGFLKCADCGMGMRKSSAKGIIYYSCRTHKEKSRIQCSKHSIRHDLLEEAVLKAIQVQIGLAKDMEDILLEVDREMAVDMHTQQIEKAIQHKSIELERIQKAKDSLYMDWKSEMITYEEYLRMKDIFEQRITLLTQDLKSHEEECKLSHEHAQEASWMQSFRKEKNVTSLNRTLLVCFVDTIFIHEDHRITIQFCFEDSCMR